MPSKATRPQVESPQWTDARLVAFAIASRLPRGEAERSSARCAVSSFGTLLRFAKTPHVDQPRVLLLAPLSGHFATLLRDTVRTMLPDHDVFISDWHNCRDVRLAEGVFGVEEYVQHVIDFLRCDGPWRASRRGVPAGRPGARGGRGDGRGRRSMPAAQSDADGRPD